LTKRDFMISVRIFIVGSKSCVKRAAKVELNPYEEGIYYDSCKIKVRHLLE